MGLQPTSEAPFYGDTFIAVKCNRSVATPCAFRLLPCIHTYAIFGPFYLHTYEVISMTYFRDQGFTPGSARDQHSVWFVIDSLTGQPAIGHSKAYGRNYARRLAARLGPDFHVHRAYIGPDLRQALAYPLPPSAM